MRGRRRSTKLISQGGFDLIFLSASVPHEVIAWPLQQEILVGTGGREGINRSHYLGAVYGMERIMGAPIIPCAGCSNYASDHFLSICHCVRPHGCRPWQRWWLACVACSSATMWSALSGLPS